MRLIDADEIHNLVRNSKKYMWSSPISTDRKVTVSTDDIQFGVDKIPTVDAEPVRHGRWEEKRKYVVGRAVDDDGWVELQELCSDCGKWAKTQWRSPLYCPNCGAKMDEVSE